MINKETFAMQELQKHNLNCTLIFDSLNFNGKYDADSNTIYIHKSLSEKEFLMTLFHEINHAMYCKEMGLDAYKNDYELEMERCIIADLDPYECNYYEVQAEKYAKQKTKEMTWVK
jgi:Zn-dependent peptidase ImmA (M78 family)